MKRICVTWTNRTIECDKWIENSPLKSHAKYFKRFTRLPKHYTYLCFCDNVEIWTEIITDPLGTARQSDTPYQQNQQNCVREKRGEPDYLQYKRIARTVITSSRSKIYLHVS